jgi:predicted enzyme related to lactoylglutathione lyase
VPDVSDGDLFDGIGRGFFGRNWRIRRDSVGRLGDDVGMTQTYAPGTPNWVDLGTTDIAGAAAFYGPLFGWEHNDLGPEMGNYGMFLKDGKQVAGVAPATDAARGTSWSTYFAVASADDAAKKVKANGGKVIMEPMDVMDQGRMAVFSDPAGSFFSVWQPGTHTGAEIVNEQGTWTWNELMTADIKGAKAFYPAVVGVTTRDVPMGDRGTYTLLQVGDRAIAGAIPIDPAWGAMPSQWEVFFHVDDPDAAYAKALDLGATMTVEPKDSPAGRFAVVTDPQGGTFTMINNDRNATI